MNWPRPPTFDDECYAGITVVLKDGEFRRSIEAATSRRAAVKLLARLGLRSSLEINRDVTLP
jgi:hypothetical protein